VGLARLGVGTGFAGRFAVDGFGPWLREHLSSNGVDLSFSVEATEPATLAVVVLDGAGRASYTFYGPETADWQWSAGELPAVPGRFGAVHTGSLVATFEPGASVLAAWLESVRSAGEAVVSLDPNVRRRLVSDPSAYRERLERLTSCAHIVKASDEDLAAVYPGEEVEAVAGAWLSGGAALVVVTEGECGATAFHASGERSGWAPPAVEVADTIGAGDAFSAALLARFASEGALSPSGIFDLGKDDLDLALRQAVAASAFTCTRPGADPPTLGELNEFLRLAPPTLR
jgi:fructokinase